MPFDGVQGNETVSRFVETRKTVLVRYGAQSSVESVRPAVISAHECTRTTRILCDLHAAMPTHVAKRAYDTILAAHDHDRYTSRFARDVRTDVRQCRGRTKRHRRASEHCELAR